MIRFTYLLSLSLSLLFIGSCGHSHNHKHDGDQHNSDHHEAHDHPGHSHDGHDHDNGHNHDGHDHGNGHSHGDGHEHHHGEANKHMHNTPFEELVERFESKERDEYQQPDKVLQFLGDVSGKKIMDIGAGTGYFSFRLADAGAQVIAADVDDQFLDYVSDKKKTLALSDEQLSLRKIPYDAPSLAEKEVDMVIIVNTYHHIEDRENYFAKVKKGLKDDGKLVVIDFFKKEVPVGPPVKMKIAADQVEKELKTAGFTAFDINRDLLPYQFILTAS